ncbi:hypothetical protein DPMN_121647 [Dreissena polymorpha]|uniref:Uncharacterized protein n=1 Tax=Dreissena polymorpha TaxID=45954 RepID=A0A9D4JTB5_DREPO|nr:hypothetical protein DPMN_121647 [Dreissena polymorpha]
MNDCVHCAVFTISTNVTVKWKLVLLYKSYRPVIAWEEHCYRRLSVVFECGNAYSEIFIRANWNIDEEIETKLSQRVDLDIIFDDSTDQTGSEPISVTEFPTTTVQEGSDSQSKSEPEKLVHLK